MRMPDTSLENAALQAYLDGVTCRVTNVLGDQLIGLYLHGSAVQNDFHPQTSDIDILGLVSGCIGESRRADLADILSHEKHPVPAKGLELILCDERVVQAPDLDFPFEFAVSTGAEWVTLVESPGTASDIIINLTLCGQSGRALTGSPAAQIFKSVSRHLLRHALLEELRWHRDNLGNPQNGPSPENAVLNAARSVCAAKTGLIRSKTEGGLWWQQHQTEEEIVNQALAARQGDQNTAMDLDLVRDFIQRAVGLIDKMVC